MIVGLHHAAVLDGDFLVEFAQSVHDGALYNVHRSAGIDDRATHIAGNPHLVDLDLVARVHRNLRYFGEIPEMAEMEGNAQAG